MKSKDPVYKTLVRYYVYNNIRNKCVDKPENKSRHGMYLLEFEFQKLGALPVEMPTSEGGTTNVVVSLFDVNSNFSR